MKGTAFRQTSELVSCVCGRVYSRSVRKTGVKKTMCEICRQNLDYKRKKDRV